MKLSHILLLLFLFGLGVFFRTYRLATIPSALYPDEAMDGNDALHANLTGSYRVFYPEDYGREGLFINAQALALKLFRVRAPWVLRSVSATFGSLTVVGLYFMVSELFAPDVGLWAAFFMATGFWHILFSRIAFRAIMSPFWLVWSVYFLMVGYRKLSQTHSASETAIWPVLGGLSFGLGFHSYIAYRAMPPVVLLIAFYYALLAWKGRWIRRFFLGSTLFLASSFLAAWPLLIYFIRTPGTFSGRMSAVSIFKSPHLVKVLISNLFKTALMFNFWGDLNWRQNYAGRPTLSGIVGALFVVGIVISFRPLDRLWGALINYWRSRERFAFQDIQVHEGFSCAILWTWLTLGAIPVIFSGEAPHSLRSLLMAPMAYTFAALGAAAVYKQLRMYWRPLMLNFAVVLLATVLTGDAYNSYFRLWATNPNVHIAFTEDYVDVARQINSLPESTPKYVIFHKVPLLGADLLDGIPVSAQTIMFLTDTFEADRREQKNVHYFIEGQEGEIPRDARLFYMRMPI